jgi:hypothetical protein
MPAKSEDILSNHIAELIRDRFANRGSNKTLSKSELKKIDVVTELILEYQPNSLYVANAFIDHVLPVSSTFQSPRNLFFAWKKFKEESINDLVPVFPTTDTDETIFRKLKEDWDQLKVDTGYYQKVFVDSSRVGQPKFKPIYRMTPDFWRVLTMLRRFQNPNDLGSKYPLFTVRSFLAAQLEALSTFVDRFSIGTLVSEKAFDRYEDWYCKKFYPNTLVYKARVRPSANNPINNSEIRMSYEDQRLEAGSRLGDFVFHNEQPIEGYTTPVIYKFVREKKSFESEQTLILPPKMRK